MRSLPGALTQCFESYTREYIGGVAATPPIYSLVIPRKVNALIILCVDWLRHVMAMLWPLQHWSEAAVIRWAWARLARLIYWLVNCYVWVFDIISQRGMKCVLCLLFITDCCPCYEHNVSCICILFPLIFLHRGFLLWLCYVPVRWRQEVQK